MRTAPAALLLVASTALAQTGRFDVRMSLVSNDPAINEAIVDIEIKASSAATRFNMADQNYRITFNTDAIPAIDPPIAAPLTNPPDRSVFIEDELSVSGFVQLNNLTSFYSSHTLTGSIHNIISVNVNMTGGDGYPVGELNNNPTPMTCTAGACISSSGWVRVTRLRLDTIPNGGVANLVFNDSNPANFPRTIIIEKFAGNLFEAAEGSYGNLSFDVSVPCGLGRVSPISGCRAGHHSANGPALRFSGRPQIGSTFQIHADNLLGGTICSLLMGQSITPVPLSLLGSRVPGSSLCVDPFVTFPCSGSVTATQVFQLPNDPLLCAGPISVQWIEFTGNAFDFGTSRAAEFNVGT